MRAFFIFKMMMPTNYEHDWNVTKGALERVFELPTFSAAIAFVIAVGRIAELNNHHPDISISYTEVVLRLVTHDQGNSITVKDHQLAHKIDAIYFPQP